MIGRYEIRLSGSGGQGIILGSVILAEALGILDGYNVTQTQSYGPESRGGASKAEVVVSDDEIDHPKVQCPNVMLALTQESFDKYAAQVHKDGFIIIDSEEISGEAKVPVYKVPISKIAKEEVGKLLVTNIVALGVLAALCPLINKESLEKAVLRRVPKGTETMNQMAFQLGYQAAEKAK